MDNFKIIFKSSQHLAYSLAHSRSLLNVEVFSFPKSLKELTSNIKLNINKIRLRRMKKNPRNL